MKAVLWWLNLVVRACTRAQKKTFTSSFSWVQMCPQGKACPKGTSSCSPLMRTDLLRRCTTAVRSTCLPCYTGSW